jgi:predicted ATP-grasp superfamily ATP-dependent carboligase
LLDADLAEVPIEHLIYQELIPGGGENQWSYAGFFVDGDPVAAFTACRLRQHPPDFGRASTCVLARHDEEVEQLSRKALKALKYTGLAEVEWKRDARDGGLRFLEINARSWGWHSLSARVVGNLPLMLYNYLVEGRAAPVGPVYGASWTKWITDLPVVAHLMATGRLSPAAYARSLRGGLVSCDWDAGDPMPFILQFTLLPYLVWKRGY